MSVTIRSQSNENDKTGIFDRIFLITNLNMLKLWLTLIRKFSEGKMIENENKNK